MTLGLWGHHHITLISISCEHVGRHDAISHNFDQRKLHKSTFYKSLSKNNHFFDKASLYIMTEFSRFTVCSLFFMLLTGSSMPQTSFAWVNTATTTGSSTANFGSFDLRGKTLRAPSLLSPPLAPERKNVHWTVEEAETYHGMPWKSSIDPNHQEEPYFIDFWKFQIDYMKDNLTNLKAFPVIDREFCQDLSYVEQNTEQAKKRMVTLCFTSDEYRLIRLTLMDAGKATQVFTSVWYPRGNLPILACDLLQFQQRGHHLTIVDFQPIHETEAEHDHRYEHLLEPIRQASCNLQEEMTDRFYDKKQYFSSQTLLGRGSNPDYIWKEVFPAYKAYVQIHVSLAKQYKTTTEKVLQKQAAYDDYSAERDPAHGMLTACFGKEYTDKFVYDILFPLSSRPSSRTS